MPRFHKALLVVVAACGLLLASSTVINLSTQATWVEGTAPSGVSGQDVCYGDSTYHQVLCSYNGGSFFPVELDAISTQTTAYSAAVTDSTILCNSTAGFTVTLVTSGIPTGKTYHIKNENVGTCTISANIDNVTSYPLTQYQAITVKFDGVQYWIF